MECSRERSFKDLRGIFRSKSSQKAWRSLLFPQCSLVRRSQFRHAWHAPNENGSDLYNSLTQRALTTEDLSETRPTPRTENLVASAVQWAERIMRKVDGKFSWGTHSI